MGLFRAFLGWGSALAALVTGARLAGSAAEPMAFYLPHHRLPAATGTGKRRRSRYSGEALRRIRANPDRRECRRRVAQMARIAERRAILTMWCAA